jgi:hypothetical protein
MGFWKNLWKFLRFAGKHAPEIIAIVEKARSKDK